VPISAAELQAAANACRPAPSQFQVWLDRPFSGFSRSNSGVLARLDTEVPLDDSVPSLVAAPEAERWGGVSVQLDIAVWRTRWLWRLKAALRFFRS
jgi:hypothetical protein